ncbi:MAG: acetolactate synthase, large subunit, biosynthetic type, partial [Kiritimatiellae bacterium]|nr:acetolactate synthase, large subunit, biosynthetic type [Kiritimatiellia bacterium]
TNGSLGLVRQMQRHQCGARYFATDLSSPDFVMLARAHGLKAARVAENARLDAAVARACRARGPYLLEVKVDKEAEA